MPHTDAATADPLAHSQFQKEEGDANNDQQHQVWHQVGTCKEKRRCGSERQSEGRGGSRAQQSQISCVGSDSNERERWHVQQTQPHLRPSGASP